MACVKARGLMRNGSIDKEQGPLLRVLREQQAWSSRPLTEHVFGECLSAGMYSASGQIPKHAQGALVANGP